MLMGDLSVIWSAFPFLEFFFNIIKSESEIIYGHNQFWSYLKADQISSTSLLAYVAF